MIPASDLKPIQCQLSPVGGANGLERFIQAVEAASHRIINRTKLFPEWGEVVTPYPISTFLPSGVVLAQLDILKANVNRNAIKALDASTLNQLRRAVTEYGRLGFVVRFQHQTFPERLNLIARVKENALYVNIWSDEFKSTPQEYRIKWAEKMIELAHLPQNALNPKFLRPESSPNSASVECELPDPTNDQIVDLIRAFLSERETKIFDVSIRVHTDKHLKLGLPAQDIPGRLNELRLPIATAQLGFWWTLEHYHHFDLLEEMVDYFDDSVTQSLFEFTLKNGSKGQIDVAFRTSYKVGVSFDTTKDQALFAKLVKTKLKPLDW
jgi:hypothetical protein